MFGIFWAKGKCIVPPVQHGAVAVDGQQEGFGIANLQLEAHLGVRLVVDGQQVCNFGRIVL